MLLMQKIGLGLGALGFGVFGLTSLAQQSPDAKPVLLAQTAAPAQPAAPAPQPVAEHPRLGVSINDKSATISKVLPGLAGERAGLKVGDQILEINHQPMADGNTVAQAIHDLNSAPATITVMRDGQQIQLTVNFEASAQPAASVQNSAPATPAFVVPALNLNALKTGSRVEAHYPTGTQWYAATITRIDDDGKGGHRYQVAFDDQQPALTFPTGAVSSSELRPIGAFTNKFAVGSRVDGYFAGTQEEAKNQGTNLARGTVIAVNGPNYKVHHDGCKSYMDAWVDGAELRPAAAIPVSNPDVQFLIGTWQMFEPGAANTVVRGDQVYREYGLGAKAPPLQINADGSYAWTLDFGKPPLCGQWTPSAKIDKSVAGPHTRNGIVIKDAEGREWKVSKRVVAGSNDDNISLDHCCEGLQFLGTRTK